ncbi:hypothetical protein [Lysinibacillus parviboronicapiens]|uniref:Uncharacterized protein n=1 Tax=Lysinibacillus parviboronicapiens TaxID=436516 RepID=A0ABV2PKB8_9BACI|nr:hypothetical protein [Lysinibacillus parviboronicapiens]
METIFDNPTSPLQSGLSHCMHVGSGYMLDNLDLTISKDFDILETINWKVGDVT